MSPVHGVDAGAATWAFSTPAIQTQLSIQIYPMNFSSASANDTSILLLRLSNLVSSLILSLPAAPKSS